MDMKLVIIAAAITTVIGGVFFLLTSSSDNTKPVDLTGQREISIVLTDNGYEPREVKINKGTKVLFSTTRSNQHWPASNLHPTHDIYTEFDPQRPLKPEESWSFTFDKEGTWGLHDHIRSYFTGVIYVSE